ncbi:MRC1-like domain-containing protein [Lyophyllum atratum]|nr:MRC1-like domain-containing protein [Lyophyllum atratum]
MDDPTEDEGDKENENSRMWDRGEDKENKAVVRHRVAGTKPPLGTRKSSLFDLESLPLRGLSMSPGISADTDNDSPGNGNNESRSPFKNLMDDDDLFASPSRSTKFPTSFEARLKQTSPAAPFPSTIPLSLAPFIGAQSLFSKFSEDEPTLAPGPAALEPSFSDLFESGTEKPKGEPSKRPLGGLSVSFSDEPSPHNKLSRTSFAGDLGLTQDVALQPAFHVSGNLLRKADQIFEKEQEYVLEAANKKPQKGSELYVNDHGFLTQTRPDVASPEVYRPPSPTQGIAFNRSSEPQSSDRRPLRTISLADDVEFDSPAPLNLHLQGPSAPKRLTNAFDVMKRPAKARTDKPKLGRSEFIEQEAQESDDDEMFGFGPGMKNRENEEDGEDLDKTLETLVDDKEMDEETVAAQLVMEKYKEQEDLDDLELEKLHQAAVQGQLRKRRRNRGFGMEDSDDDSDEDEANRRIRRGMHKKQKIDRDNIKELGEHEETKSFYNVYEGDLIAGNEDFTYLQDPQPRDIVMTNQEEDNEEEEPREAITTAEVARLAREYAQEQRDDDEEYLDPHDVSWTDEKYSDEENLHVKSVDLNVRKRPAARRRGLDQADFDVGFEMAPPKQVIAEGSMSRMQSWAKGEGRSRHNGTGRNVGGAAVTGHKAKSGGGSLRSNSAASSASSASSKPSEPRRPVKAQPSLLANVAIERRNMRFG